jgi:hypothetical protein
VVKVDVEGHEDAVLDGADRILQTWRPALVLEANDPGALTVRLERLGYQWVSYAPRDRTLRPAEQPPGKGENGIAVANVEGAAARVGASES